MAQRSLPQAGDNVALSDSGPYSGDEWAEFFQAVFTGDQETTEGPLIRFWDELEVTGAGLVITTGTGAGFVYGHFLISDAPVPITVALTAAGQSRWDRVVMVQNNTNVPYNTNLALPAAYAGGVPRNSARIAIRQGSSGTPGILPTLESGPNVYMVELARYQVDDATVGTIDDRRDFCRFSTAPTDQIEFLVQPVQGWNVTDGTAIVGSAVNFRYGLEFPDVKQCMAAGHFVVPSNYAADMTVTAVVRPEVSANIYSLNRGQYGQCGEHYSTHDHTTDYQVVAMSGYGYNNCVQELSLPDVQAGDVVTMLFSRDATDPLDNSSGKAWVVGWLVAYRRN